MSMQSVRVEHCERVQLITAAKRICIANCRECVFFLGVNQRPLILGDNHKLQVRMLYIPVCILCENVSRTAYILFCNNKLWAFSTFLIFMWYCSSFIGFFKKRANGKNMA